MKIVQINATYGVGSTGKIVEDIHLELEKLGNESYVFWAIKSKELNNDHIIRIGNEMDHKIHAILRRLDQRQGWHSSRETEVTIKKLEKIKPDVIHLHNLHSNYINLEILLKHVSKHNIPLLITLHDCWYYTGYCMHYLRYACRHWQHGCNDCPVCDKRVKRVATETLHKKKQLFESINTLGVNGVSEWTTKDVNDSILKTAKIIRCIYNWIDTDIFSPSESRDEVFEKYGLDKSKKLLIGVSQGWGIEKGLKEMLAIREALADKVYVGFVGECSQVPELPGLVKIGYISEKRELANVYSAADTFINPSRMETFGLVTAEAMACGTPVVGYDNTGTREIITEKCGRLVEDGNINAMISAVKYVLSRDKDSYKTECIDRVSSYFEKSNQINKYIQLYSDLINFKSTNG